MSKIACQFLVITIAYLCLWTEKILTDHDINMDDRCSKITYDGKKADYGNCPYRYYGWSESQLRRECSRYITYYIAAETVKCSNIEHNELHQVFEYSLQIGNVDEDFKRTIIIENSSIPILRTLQVKHIEITKFQLSNLSISQIAPGFFSGILNLTSISLDNNNLTEIIDGTLSPLNKLEDLNLSKNRLQEVKEHTFSGLISLTNLKLTKNNISKISPNAFIDNNKLIRVDLSENHIESVPYFSSNDIAVNLSHNNISAINISCSIQDLNVSYNAISTISNLSRNIEIFDVSYNKLNNISTIFFDTQQLRTLNISHNILSDIPIDSFKSLKNILYLDLSYNQLTKIEFGVLSQLSSLEYLNIEGNRLSTLNPYVYPLNNLKTFYFDSSNWQCKSLAEMVHILKSKSITFTMGSNNFDTRNVDGIPCNEDITETKNERPEIKADSGINFDNYFQTDFKKSEFYKYLQSVNSSAKEFNENLKVYLQIQNMTLEREDEIIDMLRNNLKEENNTLKEFDTNFKMYLRQLRNESLKKEEEIINILKNNLEKDSNNLISVNNSLTYYLDKIQSTLSNNSYYKTIANNVSVNSNNLNYFNEDFNKTNFYKYMENFRMSTGAKYQETTLQLSRENKQEGSNNGGAYVNLLSNILQLATLALIVYAFVALKKYMRVIRGHEQNIALV